MEYLETSSVSAKIYERRFQRSHPSSEHVTEVGGTEGTVPLVLLLRSRAVYIRTLVST